MMVAMMMSYRIITWNPPVDTANSLQQGDRGVTWRGILSISCMDGWVRIHACICAFAWMGFGTGHPSVNDASAFLGRAQSCRI
jgi:hypothetical protein